MSERASEQAAARDPEAVRRFVERFASVMADAGMARMPVRVFAALLATDSGKLTAAELAEQLQASPAAISQAVRYLAQLNMLSKDHEPGSRRDHYRVHDDAWYEMSLRREQLIEHWASASREGIEALGPDTPAGMRMAETLAFLEFMQDQVPRLLQEWNERKARLRERWAREGVSGSAEAGEQETA